MILQRLWNRWMTTEPCHMTPDGICNWEENDADVKRWEQGLVTLLGASHDADDDDDDDDAVESDRPLLIHVKQTEAWDCGIACLLMALKWLHHHQSGKQCINSNSNSNSNNTSSEEGDLLDAERKSWILQTVGTESIWSIDLVFILEEYKKKILHQSFSSPKSIIGDIHFAYLFSSKTLEVDDDHKDLRFYQKAFGTDQARVGQLFRRAQREDWNAVVQHHLQLDQVMELIRRPDCIAIALVDNNTILRYKRKNKDADAKKFAPYAGHYIVLSGVTGNGELQIHNPSKSKKMQRMSLALFEKAWRAKGTDSDILFLVRQ